MSTFPKAVAEGWHPVAALSQVKRKPLARRLMGVPLAIFQTSSGPAILIDRCPHRNMALSRGNVIDGAIACAYHGWRFNGAGRCVLTPGADAPARHAAQALPVIVRAGMVWTTLNRSANDGPLLPHPIADETFDTFLWPVQPSEARLTDAVENLLDPAHPHFLHPGIVRAPNERRPVNVTVRVRPTFAEAVYVENARAAALMPRLLEGDRSTSIGRFFPPSIGQIAFANAAGIRLAITVFFTPEHETSVRPFAHFATPKGVAPAWIKQALLRAFHIPVLAQDRAALRQQTQDIFAFGHAKYALGPLDFLLPAITALAAGEVPAPEDHTATIQL